MRIIQMLPSISYGDGVGNDCLAIHEVLTEEGYDTAIYAGHIGKGLNSKKILPVKKMGIVEADDIIIYHLSTGNNMSFQLGEMPGKKILRYHNITPGYFFKPYSVLYQKECDYGRSGLRFLADKVQYCITASDYNREELQKLGYQCPMATVPSIIPFEDYNKSSDHEILSRYDDGRTNIIFTGRISPNKCQEDVIKSFYLYKKHFDKEARLFLVGSWNGMEAYCDKLKDYVEKLELPDVYFTGHIPFEQILSYYKLADVFVCMSEHEGFCIPLVEAMYFRIPIVAYNSSAIVETLGESGILLNEKNHMLAAACIARLRSDEELRSEVIAEELLQLNKFAIEKTKRLLLDIIKELTSE